MHSRPRGLGSLIAAACLALSTGCAPSAAPTDGEPPNDPPRPAVPATFAVRVPLPASTTEPRFPHLAIGANDHLAVLSAHDDGLLVFDQSGALRASVPGLGGVGLAASGETLAVAAEDAVVLRDLDGVAKGDPIPTGPSTSIARHPDGGFVVAYEDDVGTRIDRIDEDGVLSPLWSLDGWRSDGWTMRPIAVRDDGSIGLVLRGEGADQPSALLGVPLTNDVLSESGARHLFIVIDAVGALEEAITYRNFDRRSTLHGHEALDLIVEEVTVGSSIRSAITGAILAEGRVEAQRVAAVVVAGTSTTATLLEGITPLLAQADDVFAMRQAPDGASLELTNGTDTHVPLVSGGLCREFAITTSRLLCVCEQPPVPTLAAPDDEPDDDATGFALSVLLDDVAL